MHRSSESVAAIATALAKAQTELTNPEKSMVGTIYHNNRGDNPQTFRYAPLSSGLEIVRKILGGQQIAVAQATDVDRANGLINLTTILMHTSGEWISSDWPVCQLSDASVPRRMGAALTYARRYALFTLVGITGEDDLDAPDIADRGPEVAAFPVAPRPISAQIEPPEPQPLSGKQARPAARKNSAATEDLTATRTRLLNEIAAFASLEALQAGAARILKTKNRLGADDAKLVEAAFKTKQTALETTAPGSTGETVLNSAGPEPSFEAHAEPSKASQQDPSISPQAIVLEADPTCGSANPPTIDGNRAKIDKSALAISEPKRRRDKMHLRFVATQPCLICERSPSDPHHLRFAQPRALGRKTSDEFVVPLCRTHHRQNHRFGDERKWWSTVTTIDPLDVAHQLWSTSEGKSP